MTKQVVLVAVAAALAGSAMPAHAQELFCSDPDECLCVEYMVASTESRLSIDLPALPPLITGICMLGPVSDRST